MMRSDNDLHRLITLAYRETIGPGNGCELVEEITRYLDGAAGWLLTHDFDAHKSEIHSTASFDAKFVKSYTLQYDSLNPWLQKAEFYRQPGTVVVGRQVIRHRELVRSKFYTEWLRPQGLYHRIAGVVQKDGSRITNFEVLRGQDSPAFGRREVRLFRHILPHLEAAFAIGRIMRRMQVEWNAAWEVLDRLPFGVVFVDHECKPLKANYFFKEFLVGSDGLTVAQNGVCGGSHRETTNLRELVAAAASMDADESANPDRALTLSRLSGNRPFQVVVSPVDGVSQLVVPERPAAAVIISDPERRMSPSEATLRQLYQLTKTEARLAALIAQGKQLKKVAEELGIGVNTARTHLKRIFSKTGAKRQAELVNILLTGTLVLLPQPVRSRSAGRGESPPRITAVPPRKRVAEHDETPPRMRRVSPQKRIARRGDGSPALRG